MTITINWVALIGVFLILTGGFMLFIIFYLLMFKLFNVIFNILM
jgi:hypothetical protein